MFDGQHDFLAFVGSSGLLHQSDRMCVALLSNIKVFPALTPFCSGRKMDRHPSDESSLTSVKGAVILIALQVSNASTGKAMRTSFKPRALIHELARSFRPAMEGCNIINSHLERESEKESGLASTPLSVSNPLFCF